MTPAGGAGSAAWAARQVVAGSSRAIAWYWLERLRLYVFEEGRALQAIHNRPLDLGQVEGDAGGLQAQDDRLEALECARIDEVDRRAHQHDVLKCRPRRDQIGSARREGVFALRLDEERRAPLFALGRRPEVSGEIIQKMRALLVLELGHTVPL